MSIDDWGSEQKIPTFLFIPALTENEWRHALSLSVFQISGHHCSRHGLCDPYIIEQFRVPKRVVSRLNRLTFKEEIGVIEVGRWVTKYFRDISHRIEERPTKKIKYLPLITSMLANQTKWTILKSPDEKHERGSKAVRKECHV